MEKRNKWQLVPPDELMSEEQLRAEEPVLIREVPADTWELVQWCVRRRLIRNEQVCEKCNTTAMYLRRKSQAIEKLQWHCKTCNTCTSVRHGSLFERSKLKLEKMVIMMILWCDECPQKFIAKNCRIPGYGLTVMEWCKWLRKVCEKHIDALTIGGISSVTGLAKVVEITRNKVEDGLWIMSAIERDSRKCFLEEVRSESADTTEEVVLRRIEPGTQIITSNFGFETLGTLGSGQYEHLMVPHNFSDKNGTGAHTQTVKKMWFKAKKKLFNPSAFQKENLKPYLAEFAFRYPYVDKELFPELLIVLREQYS